MRVVCLLDDVLKESPLPSAQLEARLGLDARTIKKLRLNKRDWRLDADAFTKLMLYGFEHGLTNGIFAIRPHPIWRTFGQDTNQSYSAVIYRASRVSDAKVEADVTSFLQRLGCVSTTVVSDPPQTPKVDDVREAMRSQNCVFVGSPKSNAASEIAVCLLWGIKPFQNGPAKQNPLPFSMLAPDHEVAGPSSMIVRGGMRHGFTIHELKRGNEPARISVAWIPPAEYEASRAHGQDAALVVVANSPLGTTKDVTTIIILGYTGLSTRATATQLMLGEPPVTEESMAPGRTHVLAYTFQYRKPKRSPGATGELRQEVPESGKWGPPWSAVSDT